MWEVGCEACHGPGAAHVETPEEGYGEVTVTVCGTCHTSSMSPDFDYNRYAPLIVHGGD
jgi:hypothetical protein